MMNSKYAIAIVPLLVILLDVVPVVPLQAETIAIDPEEITIEAMADSYVNQTAPDANYGGDARLYVSSKGITYLMFLLPPSPVQRHNCIGKTPALRDERLNIG